MRNEPPDARAADRNAGCAASSTAKARTNSVTGAGSVTDTGPTMGSPRGVVRGESGTYPGHITPGEWPRKAAANEMSRGFDCPRG